MSEIAKYGVTMKHGLFIACALSVGTASFATLDGAFRNPPDSARSGGYWYFLDGNPYSSMGGVKPDLPAPSNFPEPPTPPEFATRPAIDYPSLVKGFSNPPREAALRAWWFWHNGQATRSVFLRFTISYRH